MKINILHNQTFVDRLNALTLGTEWPIGIMSSTTPRIA